MMTETIQRKLMNLSSKLCLLAAALVATGCSLFWSSNCLQTDDDAQGRLYQWRVRRGFKADHLNDASVDEDTIWVRRQAAP